MGKPVPWAVIAWLLTFPGVAAVSAAPPLTRVAEIRTLPPEEAAKGLPVSLHGTVIYKSQLNKVFILYDGQMSMAVHFHRALAEHRWAGGEMPETEYEPGAVLEIEGRTAAGDYAPVLLPVNFHRVGTALLPPARRVSMERLISGSEVSQRVELEGVVQAVAGMKGGRLNVTLMVEGFACDVEFQQIEGLDPDRLIDARVRVRGCSSPIFNIRSEATRLRLLSQNSSDLTILQPAPSDPFAAPRVSLRELLPFSPVPDRFHRKVTQGVVNFVSPGEFLFVEDEQTGVRVETSASGIRVGDRVDVAGFVDTRRSLASLHGALVRPLGPGRLPPPVRVPVRELLASPGSVTGLWSKEGDFFGRLVRLSGMVRRVEWKADGPSSLFIASGDSLFPAVLPASGLHEPPWSEGMEVELTGVCELSFQINDQGLKIPKVSGFTLWLRSPEDLRVLNAPSWWTPRRLWLLVGGIGAGLLLVLAWVRALQREVQRRGTRLAAEIAARQKAVVEFDTRLRERTRLAGDLHDTLEQALTGLALQLEAAELFQESEPGRSGRHLRLAQQFLDRSREDVHRTVWDLRAKGLDGQSLADALRQRTAAMVSGQSVTVTVECEGEAFVLPEVIAGNLLLLAQEAVTNALKHARARTITVLILYHAEGLTVSIRDDGSGFDPARAPGQRDGHFGLQGMRERIKRLGGTLHVTSRPGAGTRVEARLPAAALSGESADPQPLPIRTIATAPDAPMS